MTTLCYPMLQGLLLQRAWDWHWVGWLVRGLVGSLSLLTKAFYALWGSIPGWLFEFLWNWQYDIDHWGFTARCSSSESAAGGEEWEGEGEAALERGLAAGDCQRLAAALSTFTAAACSVQDICYCFFGQQPLQFYMASNYSHSPRCQNALVLSLSLFVFAACSPPRHSFINSRHLFHFTWEQRI